jgi:acetoin utilization deacetylase AcuC-like enzyme
VEPVIYADPSSEAHDGGSDHPERPERLRACLEALEGAGLQASSDITPATGEQLARVHDAAYLGRLERFCARGGGRIDADTYATAESFAIARRASGALCQAVDEALASGRPAFCLVRPPGHHAAADQAMGFCLINHVAVGAAQALATGAGRVAIVDFDVHHGNGTQDIFWEDPRVLYVSLHQYPWYPGTGKLDDVGSGPGAGTTVNIPLPAHTTESIYVAAMRRVVLPALSRFQPDLVAVSAGFDAHQEDPLGSMAMSSAGFGVLSALLMEAAGQLCGGRLVMTLEGGYDLDALASSLLATLGAMGARGAPTPPELDDRLEGPLECLDALERAIAFHGLTDPPEENPT